MIEIDCFTVTSEDAPSVIDGAVGLRQAARRRGVSFRAYGCSTPGVVIAESAGEMDDLAAWLSSDLYAGWRRGKALDGLVFTNGCFDVLHAGHVHLLTEARAQGSRLVVGLDSDASVLRLKGRCVNPAEERRTVLLALRCVDEVRVFDGEGELVELVRTLRPAVLVKGSEPGRRIPGAELAGRVHLVGKLPGRSTTEILRRACAVTDAEDGTYRAEAD